MSDKIYSLEELVELVPEIAEFDDFACFRVEEPELKARVCHVNDQVDGAIYIGRAMPPSRKRAALPESPFANQFKIGDRIPGTGSTLTRADAIAAYRGWLTSGPPNPVLAQLPELRNRPLACWCRHDGAPTTPATACHGDVLIELLERYSDEELRAMGAG